MEIKLDPSVNQHPYRKAVRELASHGIDALNKRPFTILSLLADKQKRKCVSTMKDASLALGKPTSSVNALARRALEEYNDSSRLYIPVEFQK